MMDQITQYVLMILSASILSSVALQIVGKNSAMAAIIKMLTALFLLLTVVRPVINTELTELSDLFEDIEISADMYVFEGETMANNERKIIIKDRVEAYISDRALFYGVSLDVDVADINEETMQPGSVFLRGDISPYTKGLLQKEIANDLGIPEDKQIWN